MARLARVTMPGLPHHVTHRGNRRQPVFFVDDDYRAYREELTRQSRRFGLRIWADCLMTNHVHLIVVPEAAQSLAHGLGETHRRYTRYVNFREGWRGYLWQGRFGSVPLDEPHLLAAMRYVECNPVAAGLVARAADYRWSSARAHVTRTADPLLSPCFLTDTITDWAEFLAIPEEAALTHRLELHIRTGRPLGTPAFIEQIERYLGRSVQPQRRGPKAKHFV